MIRPICQWLTLSAVIVTVGLILTAPAIALKRLAEYSNAVKIATPTRTNLNM